MHEYRTTRPCKNNKKKIKDLVRTEKYKPFNNRELHHRKEKKKTGPYKKETFKAKQNRTENIKYTNKLSYTHSVELKVYLFPKAETMLN